jgi:hypothetical protein
MTASMASIPVLHSAEVHYRKRLNFRGPKTHENKPKPTKIENFRRQADENRWLFASAPTKIAHFRRLWKSRRK